MAFALNNTLKNALLGNIITYIAGTTGTGGTASLTIRAGAQPDADATGTGGTLCVITGIGWEPGTAGTSNLSTSSYVGTAGSTDTAVWARLECISDTGTCRIDGDVGTASTNTFTINTVNLTEDGEVTLSATSINVS